PGQAGTAILPDAPRVRGAARSPNNRSDSRFRDSSRFRVAALSRYALSRSSHRRHSGDDEMLQSVGTTRPGRLCALASLAAALFALPRPARAEIINRHTEIQSGKEAASQVEHSMPVDVDPVAVAKLRGIGRRLVAKADDKTLPFEFHVIQG